MREIKEHDERKNEIVNAAMQLFVRKGYAKTTVNDILNEVQIAKGTFYYYFKSKEEVLDGIIEDMAATAAKRIEMISLNPALTPQEKIIEGVLALNIKTPENAEVLDELHESENALMHQKSLREIVTQIAPIMADIVKEGIKKGDFHTQNPNELSEFFLTVSCVVTDQGIFQYTPEKQMKMINILINALEVSLGVKVGTFSKIIENKLQESRMSKI